MLRLPRFHAPRRPILGMTHIGGHNSRAMEPRAPKYSLLCLWVHHLSDRRRSTGNKMAVPGIRCRDVMCAYT